jgi:hypothetical protein
MVVRRSPGYGVDQVASGRIECRGVNGGPVMVTSFLTALAHPSRAAALMVALIVAGCGGSASGATRAPASASPSPGPTAGPTSYAAWIEREGFGGQSGLRGFKKAGDWVVQHPTEETSFMIDSDVGDIRRIVQWLDAHPPTSCWADYHAATRRSLETIVAAYAQLRISVEASQPPPLDIVAAIGAEGDTAFARPEPTNCP